MQTLFLARPGGKVAYDERGSGPLVVCAPGFGDVRGEYRFLAPQLEEAGFRVATMDLRGHGESSVGWADHSKAAIGSDIVALIRHLGSGPALVIGESYAAGAAVFAAAEAPELVAGIVLAGPFVRTTASPAQQRRSRLLYRLLFARPWGVAAWKMYFRTLYPTRKPDDFDAYVRALTANLRAKGRLEAVRAMMTGTAPDADSVIDRVRCPVLVLMGSRDPDFKQPRAEAEWIAGRLHGEVRMIEGAGHYPHAEMPEQAGPAVVAFARQVTR